jgi:hypothetical protein
MSAVLRLKLTREEVLVLMQIAQIPGMVGMQPFEPVPHGEALFELALRTLIARGMVQLGGDGQMVIDQSVLGIIAASAGPDVLAIIDVRTAQFEVRTTFPIQLKPGLLISHQAVQDIHTFEIYEDIREIAEQATRAMQFQYDIPQANVAPLQIRDTTLARAREVRAGGVEAIAQALREDAGDAHAQGLFARTLASSDYNASFTLLKSITEQVDGFVMVASPEACFTIVPDRNPQSNLMFVEPVSTLDIRRRVHGVCLTVL